MHDAESLLFMIN